MCTRTAIAAIATVLLAGFGPAAPAATITVTTDADELDGSSGNGDCSLREAVVNANANDQSGSDDCAAGEAGPGTVDEIVFDPVLDGSTISLTIAGAAEMGDLDLSDDVVIRGNGGIDPGSPIGSGSPSAATAIAADGSPYDRIFHVANGTQATLEALMISGGNNVDLGGGIRAELSSVLTLRDVLVTGNTADAAGFVSGGGINAGGELVIERSAIFGNTAASADGGSALAGGILAAGNGSISESYVGSNEAQSDGGRAKSGGIRIEDGDSTFTIERSVIVDNAARTADSATLPAFGGGVHTGSGTGSLVIEASVIAGNTAEAASDNNAGGGGLLLAMPTQIRNATIHGNTVSTVDGDANGGALYAVSAGDPPVTLNNATVTANEAVSTGTGSADAGGILGDADLALGNSLLLGNTDTDGDAPDCQDALASNGYNILGDGTGCSFNDDATDQVGTGATPIAPADVFDPDALQDNGGRITIGDATISLDTVALADDGPAVDAGDPNMPGGGGTCETEDQRGGSRPVDGDGDGAAACDIGAFELGASLPGDGGNGGDLGGGGGGGGALGWPLVLALLGGLAATTRRRHGTG